MLGGNTLHLLSRSVVVKTAQRTEKEAGPVVKTVLLPLLRSVLPWSSGPRQGPYPTPWALCGLSGAPLCPREAACFLALQIHQQKEGQNEERQVPLLPHLSAFPHPINRAPPLPSGSLLIHSPCLTVLIGA